MIVFGYPFIKCYAYLTLFPANENGWQQLDTRRNKHEMLQLVFLLEVVEPLCKNN